MPMPPKSCLTTIMAKKSPIRIIHSGVLGGQTKDSSMPVTTALRSPTDWGLFMMER